MTVKDVLGPAKDPHKLYSFKEAAPLFSETTSEQSVKRWVAKGLMPYVQLPHGRVLRGCDINEFVNGRVTQKRSA